MKNLPAKRTISYVPKADVVTARKVSNLIETAADRARYLAVCYLFGACFFFHAGAVLRDEPIVFKAEPWAACFFGFALLLFGGRWYVARRKLYQALDALEEDGTLPP